MTAVAELYLRSAIRSSYDGIAHLLRDQRLAVPPFQRSYSWTGEQVEEFWSDLHRAKLDPAPDYFLGTVVLTPDAPRSRMTIIDGQQRLATTVMLLAAIRNQFLDAGDTDRAAVIEKDYIAARSLKSAELEPRIELNEEDRDFFHEVVVKRPPGAVPEPDTESHRRIRDAFAYLSARIEEEKRTHKDRWADALFAWVDFVDQGARVIVVVVSNEADAFNTFETLNDRGLDMTIADLLKNYLFSLTRTNLRPIQLRWRQMLALLDAEEDQQLTDFLRYFWSSHYGATRERELYRALRRNIRTADDAERFVSQLRAAAGDYAALLSASHERWTESRRLRASLEVTLRFGLKQHRPLLLAAVQEFDSAEFGKLLRANIAWSVRGLVVGGIGGGTTERHYAEAAVAIRKGRARDARGVFHHLEPIIPPDDQFRNAFAHFAPGRIRLARYLLAAIDRNAAESQTAWLVDERVESDLQVQQVLPRGAAPDEWPGFEDETIRGASRLLGNYVLFREGEGIRLRGSWQDRRRQLEGAQLQTTAAIARLARWTLEAIRKRQQEFAASATEIWAREP